MCKKKYKPGDKISALDFRLLECAKSTSKGTHFSDAVVVRSYKRSGIEFIDVRFLSDGFVSRGHNVDCLEK